MTNPVQYSMHELTDILLCPVNFDSFCPNITMTWTNETLLSMKLNEIQFHIKSEVRDVHDRGRD